MGWGRVLQCLKGQGWGKQIFFVMRGRVGIGQDKILRGRGENPILRTHPTLLPSLCMRPPHPQSGNFFRNSRDVIITMVMKF